MTNQPPLNPDALKASAIAIAEQQACGHCYGTCEACTDEAKASVTAYLAVAQPAVSSVEELDELPPESYVQGYDGFKHAKTHSGDWVLCVEHTRGSHEATSIELPARVLYRPEVDNA